MILVGGSGGVGAASAELLAAEGAKLLIAYRSNRERALPFEKFGQVIEADITRGEDRARLLDAAGELYGIVIFAGDPARANTPDDLEAAMRRSMEINYLAPVLMAREAAARMKRRGTRGAIVLIPTMQAVALFPGSTAYAGAKAG